MSETLHPTQTLDLRTTKCPLNFVKAKLALEKLTEGELLEVWILADSQSSINIPQSIAQEGHRVVDIQTDESGLQRILIQKR